MPNEPEPDRPRTFSDRQILAFIFALCLLCGALLAIVAYSLQSAQEKAKAFDQSKQMLIAAKVLTPQNSFQLMDEEGKLVPASVDAAKGILVPSQGGLPPIATNEQIQQVADKRILPLLTDSKGEVFTLEEKGVTLATYLAENKKSGYAKLPLKLFYALLPNEEAGGKEGEVKELKSLDAVIIPVSGFGLWAPIYGYIALSKDGNHVIGTTWYEHAETPGLGANITEPWWQKQFYGKQVFQASPEGKVDLQTAQMGIIVVKGKVKDVYGDQPKAKSAVDGMSGATLTGDGVTQAYHNSLTPYRAFLTKLAEAAGGEKKEGAPKEEKGEKKSAQRAA